MRLIFFLLIILSSPTHAEKLSNFKSLYYVEGCTIFNYNESLASSLPGEICNFFGDGSFVSINNNKMRMINRKNEVVWEITAPFFHHQLNLSEDKKRILVLGSDFIVKDNAKYRVDTFWIVSLTGEILFKQSSDVILQQAKIKWLYWPSPLFVRALAPMEISHFNSFYEIPKNPKEKTNHFLKQGNLILNSNSQAFFILSPDLKKVLYTNTIKSSNNHAIHDVHISKNGNVLFFNNVSVDSHPGNLFSTVEELDLEKSKAVYSFTANPKTMFYSAKCGGVQELDSEHLLISDNLNAAYIISKKNNEVVKTIRATHMSENSPETVQEVKAYNLSDFFKNRK